MDWFEILKILKRETFEEPVPKWLEEYATTKEDDIHEIEGIDVTGHALLRMMGWDRSAEPRDVGGSFYFYNVLRAFNESLPAQNLKRKLTDGRKFTVTANGYNWGFKKEGDTYIVKTYLGKLDSKKYFIDLGYLDSDGTETARSREELIAANKVEKPEKKEEFDVGKIMDLIRNDDVLQHYDMPNLDKIEGDLERLGNYEDIASAFFAQAEKQTDTRKRNAFNRIGNLVSSIKKSEASYSDDALKGAGAVSFSAGAANGGNEPSDNHKALFGYKAILRRKKRGRRKDERD